MGEIVGAAIVSHVPTIMFDLEERLALNEGREISLVPGLERMRTECLDRLDADTVVVFDTHWFTTFEHVITAHDRRDGRYTSEELPRGMAGIPYDMAGDPELARAVASLGDERDDTWVFASDDPYLPIHYATVNLLRYLQNGEAWVSVGICQTATDDDFLTFGRLLGEAVAGLDRRVVLLGSGGLSHRFWPLEQLRDHESSHPAHIVTPEARKADEHLVEQLERGDHAAVLAGMDEFRRVSPEGFFGHYLMLIGALGGGDCTAQGQRYSDYESAAGTGQVHVWFSRPEAGWVA